MIPLESTKDLLGYLLDYLFKNECLLYSVFSILVTGVNS